MTEIQNSGFKTRSVFHCTVWQEAEIHNDLIFAGVTNLVLRAGHGLVPGEGRDGVSDQLGAGGATGQGCGVGASVTGILRLN